MLVMVTALSEGCGAGTVPFVVKVRKPDLEKWEDWLPSYWVAEMRDLSPQFLTPSNARRCLFLTLENLTMVKIHNRRRYEHVWPIGERRCQPGSLSGGEATRHTKSRTPTPSSKRYLRGSENAHEARGKKQQNMSLDTQLEENVNSGYWSFR